MNSLALGGILKRIYPDFNMKSFSNRLKLQKVIYLLQVRGINLGYSYSWYVFGPYSTGLTKDAFCITDFARFKPVGFSDPKIESDFQDFLGHIEAKGDFWLEVASSIHFLKKIYPQKSKAQIIKDIQNKREEFNDKQREISSVWSDIEGWVI